MDPEAGPIKEIDVKFDGVEAGMVTIGTKYIKGR